MWTTYPNNMDDIVNGMLTIFTFSTLEDWNLLVYTFEDSNDSIYGPIFENRFWILYYNLTVIYLCAFFFVDIFVGVIFLNYVIAEKRVKNSYLTEDQLSWINIQKAVVK